MAQGEFGHLDEDIAACIQVTDRKSVTCIQDIISLIEVTGVRRVDGGNLFYMNVSDCDKNFPRDSASKYPSVPFAGNILVQVTKFT